MSSKRRIHKLGWMLALMVLALVVSACAAPQTATEAPAADASPCTNSRAVPDPEAPGLVADCNTLLAVKDTLRGSASLNWSTQLLIRQWEGVTIKAGRVTSLRLPMYLDNKRLTGSIPKELGNLSNLQRLYLDENQLTGTIPKELGNLSQLQGLYLGDNQLTGSIPKELGNLSNLQRLYLYNNQLTDSIPKELGNLSNLQWLYLDNNQLTGTIPKELDNLSNLQALWFQDNQLTGTIPKELGNLSQLQGLYLDDNQLTGRIPKELGNLSQLQELSLYDNQLSGTIPKELGNLSQLEWLRLDNNQLTGTIPPELGSIDTLYLYGNESLGCLPNTFPVNREDMIRNQEEGMSFCDAETPTANPTGSAKSTPMATLLSEGVDQIDWENLFRYAAVSVVSTLQ